MNDHVAGITSQELDLRADFCREMMTSAGEIALEGFTKLGGKGGGQKGPQDFLTETDGAVEMHLRERIKEAFPDDGFLGEETGGEVAERVWVVDPIDGTANFARGIPHFCISVAFVADSVTQIGSINVPAMNELYFARRGQGATRDNASIHAADTESFDSASVELGWSNRVSQSLYLSTVKRILDKGANVRRGASGALGLAYVADGRSDAYIELHMNSWDCLAGLLLAEEAGARVCAFHEDGSLLCGGAVIAAGVPLSKDLSEISGVRLAPQLNDKIIRQAL